MKSKPVIVFDLDDTLINEIDYLKSAYYKIAGLLDQENQDKVYKKMLEDYFNDANVFQILTEKYKSVTLSNLLDLYRNHRPTLSLKQHSMEIINLLREENYPIGLITDGRSITQRNKLKSTKLESCFNDIVISEEFGSTKPCLENFKVFHKYNAEAYYYIADNPRKDFIAPNKLNWETICLLDTEKNNIHEQHFNFDKEYLPKYYIESLNQIKELIIH